MGLFDKLKQQGLNALQQGANALNDLTGNKPNPQPTSGDYTPTPQPRSEAAVPPPAPQAQAPVPPPAPQAQAPVPPPPAAPQHGGIYGDYMEHLIEMALADGELTEKEKQVLFKKAEAMGIDLDEFEMVLDARLFEKQKAMQAAPPPPIAPASNPAAPKSDKYGDVRKCPQCGAIVESFTTRCPDCGYEFHNVAVVSSINALFKKLEQLDAQKATGFWAEFKNEGINRKKVDLIKTFPIPNTKEDILEFLTMAAPLGVKKSFWSASEDATSLSMRNAWREKCGQVIMKARFSMKDDPNTLAEIERYAKELKIK